MQDHPAKSGAAEARAKGYVAYRYFTEIEAADYARISVRTLQRHRVEGSGARFCRAGKRILYRPEDLDTWIAGQTFASTGEADAAQ